jgi:PadR family transcriptional regulator, regulatory protein AphA
MSLEHAILGFLNAHARSGYDLKTRCFDDAAKDFWTADQAQIYRTLERLQSARMVTATRKRQAGKPDRKVYSITERGRQTLTSWLGEPRPLSAPRDAFLLQIYFAAELSDDRLMQRLLEQRGFHQERLDDLRERALHAAQSSDAPQRAVALRDAAFSGAIAHERAAIDWLDDCLEGLKAGTLPPLAKGEEQRPLFGPTTA